MNKEVQDKWTTALRSGEYQQSSGKLRTPEGYCCLGVLCDLAVKADIIDAPYVEQLYLMETAYYYDGERQYLPDSVRNWAGLNNIDPRVQVDDIINDSLSNLNDSGHTFAEIADYIEEGL